MLINKTIKLVRLAMIATSWTTLAYFSIPLRPLLGEAFLPVFYFLVWLSGLFFSPFLAFWTSFFGHLFFDLITFFSPFFVFVWFASGFCSLLISYLSFFKRGFWLILVLMPVIYLALFWTMGAVIFYDHILSEPFYYFQAFPFVLFMLVCVNPLFNFFVYKWFVCHPSLGELRRIFATHSLKNSALMKNSPS